MKKIRTSYSLEGYLGNRKGVHFIQHDIERAEGIALRTPASMDGRDDMKTPTTGSGSKLDPTRKKPKTRRKGEQAS